MSGNVYAERRIQRARNLGWCSAVCPDATKPGIVCQLDPGHEEEHRDRVLSIEWSEPEPIHLSSTDTETKG